MVVKDTLKPGDKIQAWFLWNGMPCDRQQAEKFLKAKEIYTVADYAENNPFDMVQLKEVVELINVIAKKSKK